MKIFNREALFVFAATHRGSKQRLEKWITAVSNADWKMFAHVRATYNSADSIAPNVVFDVGGDRIVAAIDYGVGVVRIKRVLTHAQYDRLDIAKL